MTIEQFIASPELKFAVITKENWEIDEVAQSLSSSPRCFELNNIEYVILSISTAQAQKLYDYLTLHGIGIDYDMVQNTGNVKLLLHSQALELMAVLNSEGERP